MKTANQTHGIEDRDWHYSQRESSAAPIQHATVHSASRMPLNSG